MSISVSIKDTEILGKVEVQITYPENENIEYFILEYWDESRRRFIPYDGKYGIINITQR